MAEDAALQPRPPPNRRRDKVQLSCDPCRIRKLRCDRQHPCGACARRGLTNSCNFAAKTSAATTPKEVAPLQQSTSLNERIAELESLVVALMKQQVPLDSSASKRRRRSSISFVEAPSEIRSLKKGKKQASFEAEPGTLRPCESGTNYVQSVHWEAILAKVRGLKEDSIVRNECPLGSHLFYGPNRHATRDEILTAVPPRPVADRLMAFHFDSCLITPYFIHSNKFLREYEAFWGDPAAVSIAWIGLMFSMLYIATQLQASTLDFTDARAQSPMVECLTMKDDFRERAVQCLIQAKYTTGGPYILETLIMILTSEFIILKEGATDGWLLVSMTLHIAMLMGYHRDPGHFSGISLFEAEMRRRIWATIMQLDLALSLESGLPRIATDTHIDAKQPLNLRDGDFDENTIEMPPQRPETEWTPILSLIAKGRLTTVLGLICDINANIKPPSYAEVAKVDALLENMHNRAIPAVLRWKDTPHSIMDTPNHVIQRVSIETSYHKSRILLHRRAMNGHPARYPQLSDSASVGICLDSALRILSFQQMLQDESRHFGRLSQLRWKVVHIFNQDVLLATSVLCLYLQEIDKLEFSGISGHSKSPPRTSEIRQQLRVSHKIWLQTSATSTQAGKVAEALSIVLGNTETTDENGSISPLVNFLTDFDAMPLDEPSVVPNGQGFSSGFYNSLGIFDDILGTRQR